MRRGAPGTVKAQGEGLSVYTVLGTGLSWQRHYGAVFPLTLALDPPPLNFNGSGESLTDSTTTPRPLPRWRESD